MIMSWPWRRANCIHLPVRKEADSERNTVHQVMQLFFIYNIVIGLICNGKVIKLFAVERHVLFQ